VIVAAVPRTDGGVFSGGGDGRSVAPKRGTVSSRRTSLGRGGDKVNDTGGSGLFGCSSMYERVIVGGSGAAGGEGSSGGMVEGGAAMAGGS